MNQIPKIDSIKFEHDSKFKDFVAKRAMKLRKHKRSIQKQSRIINRSK